MTKATTHPRRAMIPALLLASSTALAGAGGHKGDHNSHMQHQSSHLQTEQLEQGKAGMALMGHASHDDAAYGRPGQVTAVTRTIEIEAKDIRFDQTQLDIKPGATVRFVISNTGSLPHEFVLGSASEQAEHAKEMKNMMPGMAHDDPNAVTVEPGQTRELIWQFSAQPQEVEFACHLPGHYEAGMLGKIDLS